MFVLATVSASATAAFAFDRVTVKVPFNFETHGKKFPAGTYKVESAANHYASYAFQQNRHETILHVDRVFYRIWP